MTRLMNLWADDCGAVLTLEYLALGGLAAARCAAGLDSMRDSVVDECEEFGHYVRETNQSYHLLAGEHRPARPANRGVEPPIPTAVTP
jgi:hypothetical protein